VLIIGVGKYPHLRDGDGTRSKRTLGLGQLTSPPISARYFCSWFLEEYDNQERSLGSIELLLSEADPKPFILPQGTGQKDVEPATIGAVQTAFDGWVQRCQANPDNLAVFYFCGHGARIGESNVLLLADYGKSAVAPFRGAIDFNEMWSGVVGEVPGHKCFFADACSSVPVNDMDIRKAGANTLISTSNNYRFADKLTVIRAAVEGKSAYGQEEKESRFVRALVDCLKERSAFKRNNRWMITNQSLMQPLSIAMGEINDAEQGVAQIISPEANRGEVLLQVPKGIPNVPVAIEFDPSDAIDIAQMKLVSTEDANWQIAYPNADVRLQLVNSRWKPGRIPSGIYRLRAQFQNNPYKAIEDKLYGFSPPGPGPDGPITLELP
jgi:hypothetical protein